MGTTQPSSDVDDLDDRQADAFQAALHEVRTALVERFGDHGYDFTWARYLEKAEATALEVPVDEHQIVDALSFCSDLKYRILEKHDVMFILMPYVPDAATAAA